MKRLLIALSLTMCISSALHAQEGAGLPTPQKEHALLKQFAGEWESESDAILAPGQAAMKCKGTMSSKMLGGFWAISEMKANMMGTNMHGVLTLGYDAEKKKYVGTWVDSTMNYMWKYEGSLDSTGKILTLEAEGPNFSQAGKMAKFRDSYEFKSNDHIVLTTSMQGPDEKWTTFLTGNIRRKM